MTQTPPAIWGGVFSYEMNGIMSQITIDDVAYAIDALSPAARQQIHNLQVTDGEIERLQARLAIATTARAAYAQQLMAELPKKAPTKAARAK